MSVDAPSDGGTVMSATHTSTAFPERNLSLTTANASRYLVPVGRILFAAIFILSAAGHFQRAEIDQAAAHGVPLADLLVPLAGVTALAGGVSIALGYKARVGAWLIVLFLVPVTLTMHAFWNVSDPAMHEMQRIMFMKNITMLGAALYIAYHGSGPVSVDASLASSPR
jgi:putative oxidoreductase